MGTGYHLIYVLHVGFAINLQHLFTAEENAAALQRGDLLRREEVPAPGVQAPYSSEPLSQLVDLSRTCVS